MERTDAMEVLRTRTAERHARVEHHVDLPRRCATREAYAELLGELRALYVPLEQRLAQIDGVAAALPDVAERRKAPALGDDLAALGPVGAVKRAARVPAIATVDDALGCLYVLEGSTLGGALIAREIHAALGLRSTFFASYGPHRGRRWRAFGDALRGRVDAGGELIRMVAAAEETFDAFAAQLTPPAIGALAA